MSAKNYFQTLELSSGASQEEIKKAYRRLAHKYHPDKNRNSSVAEKKFKEVTEAYQYLIKNPAIKEAPPAPPPRSAGNSQGRTEKTQTQKKQKASHNYRKNSQTQPGDGQSSSDSAKDAKTPFQDIFGEVFSDLFGSGKDKKESAGKGVDLRYHLDISGTEARDGAEKIIHFIRQRNDKEDTARLSVTIPKGVKDGQRLKLSGEGDLEVSDSIPGDLYVILNVKEPLLELFTKEGADLHIDLPITFVEACLGSVVTVPTLTGETLLTIPAGTASGKKLKLKGKGTWDSDKKSQGDLFVHIQIDVPKTISPSQRQKLESLKVDDELYSLRSQFYKDLEKLNLNKKKDR